MFFVLYKKRERSAEMFYYGIVLILKDITNLLGEMYSSSIIGNYFYKMFFYRQPETNFQAHLKAWIYVK